MSPPDAEIILEAKGRCRRRWRERWHWSGTPGSDVSRMSDGTNGGNGGDGGKVTVIVNDKDTDLLQL